MKNQILYYLAVACVFLTVFAGCCYAAADAGKSGSDTSDNEDDIQVDEKQVEYAKGSLCGYCEYCKFCKLCDEDCPCEAGPGKPNCHMCKYCKFCYLCSAFCDTICKPGSILDRMSAAVVSALPSYNTKEIDGDIEGVQEWIDKKKDEL